MSEDDLSARARIALKIIDDTISILPNFEIKTSANSLVALPLLYASMDNAAVCAFLLLNRPGRSFVSVLGLHRSQWEYLTRSAFFAHVANEKELASFQKTGKMPQRSGRDIYLSEIAKESFAVLRWDAIFVSILNSNKGPLNGFVHGGIEVINAYVKNGEIGSPEIDLPMLSQILNRVVVMSQLSMAVAMSMSPLPEVQISDAVKLVYEQVQNFYIAPTNPARNS